MIARMTDRVLSSAVAAAVTLCGRLGLGVGEPSVLKDGSNVLVRLGSVVARVATMTALVRPSVQRWLARDVALARFAAARGLPVVAPLQGPAAGPHLVDGHAITLWPFTPHTPDAVISAAELGVMLGELHAALLAAPPRGWDVVNDAFTTSGVVKASFTTRHPADGSHGPVADLVRALDALDSGDAPADDLARLREIAAERVERAATAAAALPAQGLHGDPHPGNVLLTPDGPRWIDFEDTWIGPVAWDLACLANSRLVDGAAALAVYPGGPPDPEELAPFVDLRTLFGVCWGLLLARRFPHHERRARERLAAMLAA